MDKQGSEAMKKAQRAETLWNLVAVAWAVGSAVALLWLSGGCSSGYVVVAADREVVPVRAVDGTFYERTADKDGTATGWYVPDAVMLDLLK